MLTMGYFLADDVILPNNVLEVCFSESESDQEINASMFQFELSGGEVANFSDTHNVDLDTLSNSVSGSETANNLPQLMVVNDGLDVQGKTDKDESFEPLCKTAAIVSIDEEGKSLAAIFVPEIRFNDNSSNLDQFQPLVMDDPDSSIEMSALSKSGHVPQWKQPGVKFGWMKSGTKGCFYPGFRLSNNECLWISSTGDFSSDTFTVLEYQENIDKKFKSGKIRNVLRFNNKNGTSFH